MIQDKVKSVAVGDYVKIEFKPTVEALQALPRLWEMQGQGGPSGMIRMVIGGPASGVPSEESWMSDTFTGELLRTFSFYAGKDFDSELFNNKFGNHLLSFNIGQRV